MNPATPMPDEVSSAYKGRLRWHNEWPDQLLATQNLKRALQAAGTPFEDESAFFLLAAAAGTPTTEFARLHSLLPTIKLTSDLRAGLPHGQFENACSARSLGDSIPISAPQICLHCAEEDVGHWGMSWYRRTHQLRGVDWCEKHGMELVRVQSRDPFWLTPYIQVQSRSTVWVGAHCKHLQQASDFVTRYLALLSMSLLLAAPASAQTVNARLAKQAQRTGVPLDEPHALSLRIQEQAPDAWLMRHFPELRAEIHDYRTTPVDRLLTHQHYAPDGHYTLLAMAALYEDPDTAMREVFSLKKLTQHSPA